ncbi:hypothetical protein APHNP_0659 [Anaplasma phagocytophilum str. ApNP]|uniref:Uncharacterized protein n=1 Tax=Anaplasma phagocytophilum str. ApNP TaxID=1359153 RepID=A0A0F3NGY3_ANAPH|nr:hypothetical protein APHNP_0659 [Anaplasma phagocytophilum str. ApNP]
MKRAVARQTKLLFTGGTSVQSGDLGGAFFSGVIFVHYIGSDSSNSVGDVLARAFLDSSLEL